MKDSKAALAELLKGARNAAGLSQAEAAKRALILFSYLREVEGHSRVPSREIIIRVANAVGVDTALDAVIPRTLSSCGQSLA